MLFPVLALFAALVAPVQSANTSSHSADFVAGFLEAFLSNSPAARQYQTNDAMFAVGDTGAPLSLTTWPERAPWLSSCQVIRPFIKVSLHTPKSSSLPWLENGDLTEVTGTISCLNNQKKQAALLLHARVVLRDGKVAMLVLSRK